MSETIQRPLSWKLLLDSRNYTNSREKGKIKIKVEAKEQEQRPKFETKEEFCFQIFMLFSI